MLSCCFYTSPVLSRPVKTFSFRSRSLALDCPAHRSETLVNSWRRPLGGKIRGFGLELGKRRIWHRLPRVQ